MAKEIPLYEQQLLFKRMAGGDTDAFKIVFDAYRMRLFSASFKLTKSTYAAEEIVQETFLTLWVYREKLADVDHPFNYILTIAYHQSFKYLKKAAGMIQQQQVLRNHLNAVCSEPEKLLEVKETQSIIDRVVEKLPPQRQRIYKLSRERGLSHRQIADQLNISPLTVKKHLSFALQNIRAALQKMAPVMAFFLFHFRN